MKKKYHRTLLLAFGLLGLCTAADAQVHVDSAAALNQQQNFYRRDLKLDSATAARVTAIQNTYKSSLKKMLSDPSLGDAEKRARMQALIREKNLQLKGILDAQQQRKIIPTTEL